MLKRSVEWIIVIVLLLLILMLVARGLQKQDRQILTDDRTNIELTGADRAYLKEKDTVRILVGEELRFLVNDDGSGYLPEYMDRILRPSGLRAVFVSGSGKGEDHDCRLEIITSRVRADMDGRSYTSPLFQVDGSLFLRTGQDPASPLQVIAVEDRLSEKKLSELSYGKADLQCSTARTTGQAVARAVKKGSDGIIGDRCAVRSALARAGLREAYEPAEKILYSCNACVLVNEEKSELYHILNQCIQGCDRHNITYEMSEKWMDGNGPLYMEHNRQSSYLPVLIIILSVLIAFFFYYITNRSMYRELGARMDKITESRNEMQTTFHGVGHYMAELTPGGEITDVNQAFAENIMASAFHRKLWDVLDLDEEGRRQIRQMVEHAAQGRQDPRLEAHMGKKIFAMDVFPVEDAHGDVGQLLYMAIDVTQERMAKRQMLQDNKMIAIGQLAAGVAHEIRNPLGIIRNYCYVLKTMEDEEIRAKAIEEIERAVDVSGGIINDLLDFSRISPGRTELIDVEQHVRSLLALNESSFRAKNIDLVIECPEPIRTYIAREPFDMILLNLVKNAMDAVVEADQADVGAAGAAAEGNAAAPGREKDRVTISIQKTREDSDVFTLSVTDTGVGIEEEALEEIFNPFYTTKGNEGTGLGLYIVYSEIEKLNGEIDVSSRKGQGTTFRVTLPVSSPYEEEELV